MIQNPLFFSCDQQVASDATIDILTIQKIPPTLEGSVTISKNRHNGLQSSKKVRKNDFTHKKTKKTMLYYMRVIVYIVIADIFGMSHGGSHPPNVKIPWVASDATGNRGGNV